MIVCSKGDKLIVYEKELMKPSKIGRYQELDNLYNTIKRETRIHMERVGQYCQLFYRHLCENYSGMVRQNVDTEFNEVSEELFRYHDLGRAYIPGAILNKATALTDEERRIIQNHTIYAKDAINAIYDLPYTPKQVQYFLEIAVSHHERYDGGGYPDKLMGDEIPFLAKLCSVADTFDGITSWKPYKTVQTSREKAADIIMSESGKQFDPFFARSFVEIIPILPEF